MEPFKIVFTLGPIATGIMSAFYWYRASEVSFGGVGLEPLQNLEDKVRAQGLLNRSAAIWAVATAVLDAGRILFE
jgi:hypothetical protein